MKGSNNIMEERNYIQINRKAYKQHFCFSGVAVRLATELRYG